MLITFCLLRSFAKIILHITILVEKKMSAATAESAAVVWHAE